MVVDYKDFGSRGPERDSLFPWANECLFGTLKGQALNKCCIQFLFTLTLHTRLAQVNHLSF
jgi:hypothetical protein